MQSGPFNSFLSQTCAVDEKTVMVYTRALKEAGLMTAGQGRYAPHMLPLDAARALIALMATDRPSEAVATVQRWQAFRLRRDESTGDLSEAIFHDDPTLEQALVRMFALDPDPQNWVLGSEFPAFEVSRNEGSATLEWGHGPDRVAVFRKADRGPLSLTERQELAGIRRATLIAPSVMMRIATGLWADRFQGSDEKGHSLDLSHPWNNEGTAEERAARREDIYAYLRALDQDWRKGAD